MSAVKLALPDNSSPRDNYASRLAANWVDQGLLKAIRNIFALGALEVSASQDQDCYLDKPQCVRGISLQVASFA